MKVGFVYSGQGSQYYGMGQELYESEPIFKQTIDEADQIVDFDLKELMFDENEKLHQTEYTQPALLAMEVGLTRLLAAKGIKPDVAAGLSLGEYAALVASGALDFAETVRLVQKRGRFMTEAVPSGKGAMAAIMGLDRQSVITVCKQFEDQGVIVPANYNMPGQIVIAGEKQVLDQAVDSFIQSGAKRVIPLNVSGPFHSELLEPAAVNLAEELQHVRLSPMTIPVVTNLTGSVIASSEEIVPTLIQQVKSPVYWEECIETMIQMGVDYFVEVGPGRTLCSFIKKIDRSVKTQNVENQQTLEKVIKLMME